MFNTLIDSANNPNPQDTGINLLAMGGANVILLYVIF